MLGVIAVIAWGALRLIQTTAGKTIMSFFGWLTHFVVPAVAEGEEVVGLAALPKILADHPVPLYMLAGAIALIGIWVAFRIVNMPRVAEFLIAVEAEMVKVSWPSSRELYVTTIVVITVMLIFCVFLAIYDFVWQLLFRWIGVL
ncbi:MAG: preprotein translocase subunit SecE [Planctomycetaceae bacterium]|jgi:preprotein translocase subunit SecE|nr:preprotein translocase subunit SecE [Planctomycetaceae bacterium]